MRNSIIYKYMYMTTTKMIASLSIAITTLLMACGGGGKQNSSNEQHSQEISVVATQYDFRIVQQHKHASTSYTQGLQYVEGVMWEGTGREGMSHLQCIDLATGECDIVASLPKNEFGEGITHHNGRIYQLTWEEEIAHVYDAQGNELKTIPYKGEGWGITSDGQRLYMSDGSAAIRIVNEDNFATEGVINVTFNNMTLDLINELEWIEGSIWANIYLTDLIVEIDPKSGKVVGYVDLEPLRSLLRNNPEAEALNGIAYNSQTKHLYVTGKDWNTLFEIEIIK